MKPKWNRTWTTQQQHNTNTTQT